MKRLAQIFSVVTVMALVVNAQCVASCSIQAVLAPAGPSSVRVLSQPKTHAHCPHHESADPQGKSETPCPNPTTQVNGARLESRPAAVFLPAPISPVAEFHDRFLPPPSDPADFRKHPDSMAKSRAAAFLVLRV